MANDERIQTMQAFMGHFNPVEAERMAQGWKAQIESEGEGSKLDPLSAGEHPTADERFLQTLSALQDTFPDLEITFEDRVAAGDKVTLHVARASH